MSYELIAESVKNLSYEEKVDLLSVIVMLLKEHSSSSDIAVNHKAEYPIDFFDNFGSDPEFNIKEPEELSWDLDSKREVF